MDPHDRESFFLVCIWLTLHLGDYMWTVHHLAPSSLFPFSIWTRNLFRDSFYFDGVWVGTFSFSSVFLQSTFVVEQYRTIVRANAHKSFSIMPSTRSAVQHHIELKLSSYVIFLCHSYEFASSLNFSHFHIWNAKEASHSSSLAHNICLLYW